MMAISQLRTDTTEEMMEMKEMTKEMIKMITIVTTVFRKLLMIKVNNNCYYK